VVSEQALRFNRHWCGCFQGKAPANALWPHFDVGQTDFGERIPHVNISYHDGSDPMRMHNAYSVLYNELVFNLLKSRLGEGQAVVFARASAAGGQR